MEDGTGRVDDLPDTGPALGFKLHKGCRNNGLTGQAPPVPLALLRAKQPFQKGQIGRVAASPGPVRQQDAGGLKDRTDRVAHGDIAQTFLGLVKAAVTQKVIHLG